MIIEAIESSDAQKLITLGASSSEDINFEITSDGIFPLLIASAKGSASVLKLMLMNETIDVN